MKVLRCRADRCYRAQDSADHARQAGAFVDGPFALLPSAFEVFIILESHLTTAVTQLLSWADVHVVGEEDIDDDGPSADLFRRRARIAVAPVTGDPGEGSEAGPVEIGLSNASTVTVPRATGIRIHDTQTLHAHERAI